MSAAEAPAPSPLEQEIERLRSRWAADIGILERMGDEVTLIRRRFREGLQDIDRLHKVVTEENRALRTEVEDTQARLRMKEGELAAAIEKARLLELAVEELERQRMGGWKP